MVVLFVIIAWIIWDVGRGVIKNDGICVETELILQDVVVQDPLKPLILTAQLLADGKPLVGGEVNFGTKTIQAFSPDRTFDGGRHIGEATTNSEGVAEFIRPEGLDGLTLPNETLTGYNANFKPLTPINEVQYCHSRSEAGLQLN